MSWGGEWGGEDGGGEEGGGAYPGMETRGPGVPEAPFVTVIWAHSM